MYFLILGIRILPPNFLLEFPFQKVQKRCILQIIIDVWKLPIPKIVCNEVLI